MASVRRITRDEILKMKENEDPWKIIMNPRRPRKRARLAEDPTPASYIYEQNLDEFDHRLNFHYSVTLYGSVVDWERKGKGAEKFRTYDKIEYSGLSISIGDIVYVNFGDPEAFRRPTDEDTTTKPEPDNANAEDDDAPGDEADPSPADAEKETDREPQEPIPDWVAKVLECRAFDEEHVFLRVLWLYRPEDLPNGRSPWHGANEVFPSNNMQIIDAMTVTDMTKGLLKWDEKAGDVVEKGLLVWRQPCKVAVKGTEVTTTVLGKLPTYCVCREPANPDRRLIQCGKCKNRLHDTCIESETAKRVAAEGLQKSEAPAAEDDGQAVSGTERKENEEEGEDEHEEQKMKTPTTPHFNPLKVLTNQFKRAVSPFKHSPAVKIAGDALAAVEDFGKAVVDTIAPSTLTKNYSARIVDGQVDDEDKPLRIEIRAGDTSDNNPPLAVQRIKCLICQHEME